MSANAPKDGIGFNSEQVEAELKKGQKLIDDYCENLDKVVRSLKDVAQYNATQGLDRKAAESLTKILSCYKQITSIYDGSLVKLLKTTSKAMDETASLINKI